MFKIKFLFIAVLVLSCSMLAQNLWTSEVMIDFTIQSNTQAASYVDANGIHIVYFRNGGIKYALVNSQGGIIKYDKVIETEGSGADFANVAFAGGNVYVVYYKNNFLQVAKSTDLGDTWNNTFSNRPMINTGCNKIVAYSDGTYLHITWSELRVGSPFYRDVHYIKFVPSNVQQPWQDYKRVSDIATQYTEGGENPDLVFNSGKVYTNYIGTFYSFPINRDRNANYIWNNPEEIPFNQLPMTNAVRGVKPLIVGNELNNVYINSWGGMYYSGVLIGHSYKDLNGTTWTQDPNYLQTGYLNANTIYPHVVASTADGKIHIIYRDINESQYSYRQIINHTFTDHIANISLANYLSNVLISNGNDLFLIRTGNVDTPSKIFFRHYDAAPLAPQNLGAVATSDYHPKLLWTNTNADAKKYYIYRSTYNGGYTTPIAAVDHNSSLSSQFFIDYTISVPRPGGQAGAKYYYVVKTEDWGQNMSGFSNSVEVTSSNLYWEKRLSDNTESVIEYVLDQNYPNPFNPSTKISFSIKEEGLVTLKVYDVLGKEAAVLVNENKPVGNYEIDFDASQLPSGVYIYKLQAGGFSDVKKMLLTK